MRNAPKLQFAWKTFGETIPPIWTVQTEKLDFLECGNQMKFFPRSQNCLFDNQASYIIHCTSSEAPWFEWVVRLFSEIFLNFLPTLQICLATIFYFRISYLKQLFQLPGTVWQNSSVYLFCPLLYTNFRKIFRQQKVVTKDNLLRKSSFGAYFKLFSATAALWQVLWSWKLLFSSNKCLTGKTKVLWTQKSPEKTVILGNELSYINPNLKFGQRRYF